MRVLKLLAAGSISLLTACATGGLPRNGWTAQRVGEVEFYSGTTPRQTRQLVEAFAKFRVVTAQLVEATSVEPTLLTRVLLFPDQRSYMRHTQLQRSGGSFHIRGGQFVLALNANSPSGQEALFHEYTHLIVANSGPPYPTWYNEGFAELMATVRFVGDEVHVGRVAQDNLIAAAEYSRWVPLPALLEGKMFATRHDGDELRRYYAQAWLVVHYLQFGSPSYAQNISDYVSRAYAAPDPTSAFESAFGVKTPQFEKELRDYLRNQEISFRIFPSTDFDFQPLNTNPQQLSPAQTAGLLAHMCWIFRNTAKADELRNAAAAAGDPEWSLERIGPG